MSKHEQTIKFLITQREGFAHFFSRSSESRKDAGGSREKVQAEGKKEQKKEEGRKRNKQEKCECLQEVKGKSKRNKNYAKEREQSQSERTTLENNVNLK